MLCVCSAQVCRRHARRACFLYFAQAAVESVLWITQLVVHEEYRSKGVAHRLLSSVIDCGLALRVKPLGIGER